MERVGERGGVVAQESSDVSAQRGALRISLAALFPFSGEKNPCFALIRWVGNLRPCGLEFSDTCSKNG